MESIVYFFRYCHQVFNVIIFPVTVYMMNIKPLRYLLAYCILIKLSVIHLIKKPS